MPDIQDIEAKWIDRVSLARERILSEVGKVIVGQQEVLDQILICLFAGGHAVIIGVPGLAKTLMISTLARVLDLSFNRIQFTPDLMPSDITGTDIIEDDPVEHTRRFRFIKGPVFANVVLADEINRTPPKTQSALLQAMQERQVTAGGRTFDIDAPFFVLATQNPIEQEGTYPLPEAQLDRFMFNINIGYPSPGEEAAIVKSTTSNLAPELEKALDAQEIIELQQLVRAVPVSEHVIDYAVRLTAATRPLEGASGFVRELVSWGAGPRASQYLVLGAKARALLGGEVAVAADDVRAVALPVLRHRIITNFHAEARGVDSSEVVGRILEQVKPDPHAEKR